MIVENLKLLGRKKMYKIAICGKANTGKNTVSNLLVYWLGAHIVDGPHNPNRISTKHDIIAFADPIKKMAQQMFPSLPEEFFYGSSKFRAEIIPGAFKDGKPLTVRQLLIDLGTGVGREYKDNVWIDAFDYRLAKAEKKKLGIVIVTDVRFVNEFRHLKNKGFYNIRLLRDAHLKIDHSSETSQDGINDDEFDYVLKNNGSIEELTDEIKKIIPLLKS